MKKYCGEKCEQVLRAEHFLNVEKQKNKDLQRYIKDMEVKCSCGKVLFLFKRFSQGVIENTITCPKCKKTATYGNTSFFTDKTLWTFGSGKSCKT